MGFKRDLENLKFAVDSAAKNNVDLNEKIDKEKALYDFKTTQKKSLQDRFERALKNLTKSASEQDNPELRRLISKLSPALKIEELKKIIEDISSLAAKLEISSSDKLVKIPKRIPSDIKSDIVLDLEELERCFENKCYRSAVILCGRVLETALHRKYYDATGRDILEKNPGIGLGNLIKKLKEKEVDIDPALTNQIHLINQVRVFSVHKKQEAFNPSEAQTKAVILYTIDILEKLFSFSGHRKS